MFVIVDLDAGCAKFYVFRNDIGRPEYSRYTPPANQSLLDDGFSCWDFVIGVEA